MRAEVIPEHFPGCAVVEEIALVAASNLKMSSKLVVLRMVLDAPEFKEGGFWQVENVEGGVQGVLYASILDLLTPSSQEETRARDLDEDRFAELPAERVDSLAIDRWIHRNLLQLDDLLERRIDPSALSREETAAFQTCWEVWTDGRLKRLSLPGVSLAERRRVFFRAFAGGGLLLPRHWKIFHRLWDGHLHSHAGLVEALAQLPPIA